MFFIVAIAKCKNVVRQFGAENKNGVEKIFGLADHFRRVFPHPGEPVGHVYRNHSGILEAFLKFKKKENVKKGITLYIFHENLTEKLEENSTRF